MMFKRLKKWALGDVRKEAGQDRPAVPDFDDSTLIAQAYRRHHPEDVPKFTEWAKEAFPDFAPRISCFGADWLGRQFATDEGRIVDGEPQVLMLDVGAGEALQIPTSITTGSWATLRQPSRAASLIDY